MAKVGFALESATGRAGPGRGRTTKEFVPGPTKKEFRPGRARQKKRAWPGRAGQDRAPGRVGPGRRRAAGVRRRTAVHGQQPNAFHTRHERGVWYKRRSRSCGASRRSKHCLLQPSSSRPDKNRRVGSQGGNHQSRACLHRLAKLRAGKVALRAGDATLRAKRQSLRHAEEGCVSEERASVHRCPPLRRPVLAHGEGKVQVLFYPLARLASGCRPGRRRRCRIRAPARMVQLYRR